MIQEIPRGYSSQMAFLMVVFFLFSFQGHSCLRDLHIIVPSLVPMGGNITVNRSYTLENEVLVTEKYFINEKLRFSYTPTAAIPYDVKGFLQVGGYTINADGSLTLQNVSSDATGLYRCDVVTNSTSATNSAFVTVWEKPQQGPEITTKFKDFRVGDVVTANCSSRGGSPLANLTWFVDGEQVTYPDKSRTKQYTVNGDEDTAVSELSLPIVSPADQLHLRCEATQFTLYNASTEIVLQKASSSSGVSLLFITGSVGAYMVVMPALLVTMLGVYHR